MALVMCMVCSCATIPAGGDSNYKKVKERTIVRSAGDNEESFFKGIVSAATKPETIVAAVGGASDPIGTLLGIALIRCVELFGFGAATVVGTGDVVYHSITYEGSGNFTAEKTDIDIVKGTVDIGKVDARNEGESSEDTE